MRHLPLGSPVGHFQLLDGTGFGSVEALDFEKKKKKSPAQVTFLKTTAE